MSLRIIGDDNKTRANKNIQYILKPGELMEMGNAYGLKDIIVDLDEERSVKILQNYHRARTAPGKLLIIESVILPGSEHSFRKFTDLVILVMTRGCVRTETEHHTLLATTGFRLTQLIPTSSEMSITESLHV